MGSGIAVAGGGTGVSEGLAVIARAVGVGSGVKVAGGSVGVSVIINAVGSEVDVITSVSVTEVIGAGSVSVGRGPTLLSTTASAVSLATAAGVFSISPSDSEVDRRIPNATANASTATAVIATITSFPMFRRIIYQP